MQSRSANTAKHYTATAKHDTTIHYTSKHYTAMKHVSSIVLFTMLLAMLPYVCRSAEHAAQEDGVIVSEGSEREAVSLKLYDIRSIDEWTITDATLNDSTTSEYGYQTIYTYDIAAQIPSVAYVSDAPDITLTVKNSSGKTKAFSISVSDYQEGYYQAGGKNCIIKIAGTSRNDIIELEVASKGSTSADFGDTTGVYPKNAYAVSTNLVLPPKESGEEYVWSTLKFCSTGGDVEIKEFAAGFRIRSITVEPGEGTTVHDDSTHFTTFAELMAMSATNDTLTFGAFDVVYVNGKYTYIKDETGSALIYISNFGLNAGDHVEAGLRGQLKIFNQLYEIIPVSNVSELTVTPGTPPVIPDATALPYKQNMNQVVVFRNVHFTSDQTFSASQRTVTGVWGPNDQALSLYNRNSIDYSFVTDKSYDITAANTVYNATYEVDVLIIDTISEVQTDTIPFIASNCTALLSMLDPAMADSFAAGYLSQDAIHWFLYFDEPVCNDLVVTGSFNGWSSDTTEMLRMTALPECQGWYSVVIPYSDSVVAKPIQLMDDGTFYWTYQTGDAASWEYVAGQMAEVYNTGYEDEADVRFLSPGIYVYHSHYFKGHSTPCGALRHNYTVTLAAPPCYYEPAIIGDFSMWLESFPMTKNADSTYSYSWSDFEGNAFKFRASTSEEWENEILLYDASTGSYVANPNIVLGEDTLISLDYSGGTYSLGCPPIDTTYMPVTCAELMTLEDYGETFVELGAFDVVFVTGKHTYIRDTTGVTLLYHVNDSLGLKAGDHVEAGFRGRFVIYSGLYEIYPISKVSELRITPGEAPDIPDATTMPSFENMNEVVIYRNVRFAENVSLSRKTLYAYGMWEGSYDTLVVYNKFLTNYTFDPERTYDIMGANAVYKGMYQTYFISADEIYEPPTVTVFGQEVEIDSTSGVTEVDVLGDSTLIYNTEDNTLTFTGTTMTVGDSVSTAISYSGSESLTIILCDSSSIYADTIIASTSNITITGDGVLEAEGVVPIIGAPTAIITFDSVSMHVRSVPSPQALRRRIRGGKRLDETGGPALSGFASVDFNKTAVTPPDAEYGEIDETDAQGTVVRRTKALITVSTDGTVEPVTEFTLTAVEDDLNAVADTRVYRALDPQRPMYNILGLQVDGSYEGIVLQDGRKYLIQK